MKLFNSYSKNWVNRGTSILLFVSMSISPRNVSILSGDMPTRKISTLWNYVVWKGSTVLITYYSLQPVLNFSSKNLHFLTQVKIPWPSVKNNIFPLICDKPVELLFTSQSVRWFEFEAKTLEDVSFRNSISVSSFLWCNKAAWRETEGSSWTLLNTPSSTWDKRQLWGCKADFQSTVFNAPIRHLGLFV